MAELQLFLLAVVAGLKSGKIRRVVDPAVGVEAVGDGLAPLDLYFTGKTLRAPLRIADLFCQRRSLKMRVRGLLELASPPSYTQCARSMSMSQPPNKGIH